MGKKKRNKSIKKRQPTTHDKIIDMLEQRLSKDGRNIFTEYEYSHHGDHEADILVLDWKRRYAYAIEVKTTDSPKARGKARKQLYSDKKYIQDRHGINRVFMFYAHKDLYGTSPYVIERVKNETI